jgi:arylsulfatase A-like enzyme
MKLPHPSVGITLALIISLGQLVHAQLPSPTTSPKTSPTHKPNIIFILMDDLGYGDIGRLWQNQRRLDEMSFKTPNWDRMADEGMLFMQHYTAAPVCAPSRASLILGQDQGHCGLCNDEFDFPLPRDHTMATVLKQEGYHTMVIGKWGLGGLTPPWPRHPLTCGFDEFYGYMEHKSGHEHYPGNDGTVMDGTTPVTSGLEGVYTTDLWTAKAKQWIQEQTHQHPDRPFFMYLAYDTPHAHEETPPGPYPEGQGLHGGFQWPVPNSSANKKNSTSWMYPDIVANSWPEPAKLQATMIRRDDEGVGDVMQLLRDLHIDKNTLVVFSSDNGPMAEGGEDPAFFDSWGPFDGFKRDVYEGGIHMPCIAWWPGHIAAGSATNVLSGLWDWMPTFSEVAGATPPGSIDGISLLPTLLGQGTQQLHPYIYIEYKGRDVGGEVSKAFFKRKDLTTRGEMQDVRIDDFTGLRYNIITGNEPLRLYNLKNDVHEDHDIASTSDSVPILAQMNSLLLTARDNIGKVTRPYSTQLLPAVKVSGTTPGLAYEEYKGEWPWVPDFKALTGTKTAASIGVESVPVPLADATNPYVTVAQGYLDIPTDGEYTLYMQEDGGGHLWIHDAHVINDDFNHDGQEKSGTIYLHQGKHPLRVIYRHESGNPSLVVSFSGPGVKKIVLPSEALSHN